MSWVVLLSHYHFALFMWSLNQRMVNIIEHRWFSQVIEFYLHHRLRKVWYTFRYFSVFNRLRLQSTLLRHRNAEAYRGCSPYQTRSQHHLQLHPSGNHHRPHRGDSDISTITQTKFVQSANKNVEVLRVTLTFIIQYKLVHNDNQIEKVVIW